MKCRPEKMLLFDLDYGDLIRPPYRILRACGWGQCTSQTEQHLAVYGPKHEQERSIFDTSPYVVPPGATTPDCWDCEGFHVPSDRILQGLVEPQARAAGRQVLEFPALLRQKPGCRRLPLLLEQRRV